MDIIISYIESFSIIEWVLSIALFLFFLIQILYSLVLFRKPKE